MAALALGTAQFGLDYGVTNRDGQIADREAMRILQAAQEYGVEWLDTAAAYGNAEARLGDMLAGDAAFMICSKLRPTPAAESVLSSAKRSLDDSLRNLRRERLDALLVHTVGDLLGREGEALWDWMDGVRHEGLAGSIGVSVYDSAEIGAVLERFTPDWIQLPCSVFDQRLIDSGSIARLHARGVRVQARSLLLQGVVGMTPSGLPAALGGLQSRLETLHEAARAHGISTVDLALAWAAARDDIELAVIGVTRASELLQCIDAFGLHVEMDWPSFACNDAALVDPRQWPRDLRNA